MTKLLLLFSPGLSLEAWDKGGFLSRELHLYGSLAQQVGEVCWYTYGPDDGRYAGRLAEHGLKLFSSSAPSRAAAERPAEYDQQMLAGHMAQFGSFDLVKTNQFDAWRLAAEIKRRCGVPFVLRRGAWYPLRYRLAPRRPWLGLTEFFAERTAYHRADRVILTSRVAREHIVRNFHVPPSKIEVIPNGVNTDLFQPSAQPHSPPDALRICFVGRLTFQKNPTSLLHALRRLPAQRVSLTMIGTGRYKQTLANMADRWQLPVTFNDRVEYHRMPDMLAAHDVFVMPSRWEGHPKALLEAMACGLCVIGANAFGVREVIQHGETGLLYDGGPAGLAEAIARVARDGALRARLGQNARRFILDTCRQQDLIRREAEVLRSVASA